MSLRHLLTERKLEQPGISQYDTAKSAAQCMYYLCCNTVSECCDSHVGGGRPLCRGHVDYIY